MRLLLLVDCYLPTTKSSAKLMHDLAIEFVRRGLEVVMVAPDPDASEPCVVTEEQRVTVMRVRTGRMKGASWLRRGLREVRLSSTIWRRARHFFRARRCDAIIFYSPSIFFGNLVRRLKRLWSCPVYMVLRDIFPQWALEVGTLRDGLVFRYLRFRELQQYRAADVIGVESPASRQYFQRTGFHFGRPVEVLYNWACLREADLPKTHYREELRLEGKVVFFYGGTLGPHQDALCLSRLARILRERPDAHVVVVAEGNELNVLVDDIRRDDPGNITLLPHVPQERFPGMVSEFDVGLITLHPSLRTHNFPGKMLAYMGASIPILASINPGNDLRDILEAHDAGRVCLNGEDERLRSYALELAADADLRSRLGRNGRRLLESTFSVSRAAEQILAHAPGAASRM